MARRVRPGAALGPVQASDCPTAFSAAARVIPARLVLLLLLRWRLVQLQYTAVIAVAAGVRATCLDSGQQSTTAAEQMLHPGINTRTAYRAGEQVLGGRGEGEYSRREAQYGGFVIQRVMEKINKTCKFLHAQIKKKLF